MCLLHRGLLMLALKSLVRAGWKLIRGKHINGLQKNQKNQKRKITTSELVEVGLNANEYEAIVEAHKGIHNAKS